MTPIEKRVALLEKMVLTLISDKYGNSLDRALVEGTPLEKAFLFNAAKNMVDSEIKFLGHRNLKKSSEK